MRKQLLAVIALALALPLVVPVRADMEDARNKLQRALEKVKEYGYTLGDGGRGASWWVWNMNPGYYNQVDRTLFRGNNYALVAAGDSRVIDVDLKIYDENWNLVDSDTDNSSIAIVTFRPKWTGTFHIRTIYYSGRGVGSVGFFIAFKR
jgi:hypothetical protein